MLSPETIQKILHASQEGILVIDCERRVVFWNEWISRNSSLDHTQARGLPHPIPASCTWNIPAGPMCRTTSLSKGMPSCSRWTMAATAFV